MRVITSIVRFDSWMTINEILTPLPECENDYAWLTALPM